MFRVAHLIMLISYVLGVVSLVLVIAFAVYPRLAGLLGLTTRGGLIFACTVFWCAIASYLVRQALAREKS